MRVVPRLRSLFGRQVPGGMYRRWVMSCRFLAADPDLPRRRGDLKLEWFEAHLEPIASLTTAIVGVAVSYLPDLRITVTRQGFAGPGLGGLWDSIELSTAMLCSKSWLLGDVILDSFTAAGVSPLDHARTTRLSVFRSPQIWRLRRSWNIRIAGLLPVDGSKPSRLTSTDLRVQVEWGVVRDDEILARLRHPEQSRLNGQYTGCRCPSPDATPVNCAWLAYTRTSGFA